MTRESMPYGDGPCAYVIHENDAWLEPLRREFEKQDIPYKEWFLDRGVLDLAAVPPAGGGRVVDLINESTRLPTGNGLMAPECGAFVPGPILDGHLIQHIPPRDFEDAWHIVRHAISDHLPVWVRVTV